MSDPPTVIPRPLRPGVPSAFPLSPLPPRIDGVPRRGVASYNLRYEEKWVADFLEVYWEGKLGRPLAQWDVMSILIAAALENPNLDVPGELRRRLAR